MAQIYKRNNKWSYRVNYLDMHGNRKSISRSGFDLKREAENEADEVERKHRRGANLSEETISLIDYYRQWIDLYKSGRHAQVTEVRYNTIDKVIVKYFGNTKLKEIRKSDYQRFINEYSRGDYNEATGEYKERSKETVSKTNSYIRAAVQSAIDDQIIYSNFTNNVVLSGKKSKSGDLKFLELSDLSKLKQAVLDEATFTSVSKYIILTGILTGARFSEILALTWDDIDFESNTISISKSWDYTYTHTFKPTKTESSVRTININQELADALNQLKSQQNAYQLKSGWRNRQNLIFINNRREVPSSAAVNKMLRNLQKELHILSPITFHGLRHTHASYLISKNIDIFYISKRLGHKNVLVTQRVYAHLLNTMERHEADKTLKALAELWLILEIIL